MAEPVAPRFWLTFSPRPTSSRGKRCCLPRLSLPRGGGGALNPFFTREALLRKVCGLLEKVSRDLSIPSSRGKRCCDLEQQLEQAQRELSIPSSRGKRCCVMIDSTIPPMSSSLNPFFTREALLPPKTPTSPSGGIVRLSIPSSRGKRCCAPLLIPVSKSPTLSIPSSRGKRCCPPSAGAQAQRQGPSQSLLHEGSAAADRDLRPRERRASLSIPSSRGKRCCRSCYGRRRSKWSASQSLLHEGSAAAVPPTTLSQRGTYGVLRERSAPPSCSRGGAACSRDPS